MPYRNAPLTETGRLRLARLIVEGGWSVRRAAERFQVSHTTAARWARRYRERGRSRDGRPVFPPAPQPGPYHAADRTAHLQASASRIGLDPPESPPVWAWPPPPCTG
ncbi:Homeodomain-like domain-containing protein [Microbispora rosea]|uniref:Homeodomain-like domain-containing protein n=1 Tax=Microbispora rosea TaxID=58117 RepID=A0A1N7HHP3_9ACTN|nr:hypothetical protein Mro03_71460 [Microbispora rosea subsp. rosea]SIS24415.1 Homeodomain-like domain-containing protein [Microbispora rosea]